MTELVERGQDVNYYMYGVFLKNLTEIWRRNKTAAIMTKW